MKYFDILLRNHGCGSPAKAALLVLAASWLPLSLHAVERVWQTGGVNSRWSSSFNWSPVGAPASGDSLRFSGSGGSTTNDLNNLVISQIAFSSGNWRIAGNALTVTSGMDVGPHTGISAPF